MQREKAEKIVRAAVKDRVKNMRNPIEDLQRRFEKVVATGEYLRGPIPEFRRKAENLKKRLNPLIQEWEQARQDYIRALDSDPRDFDLLSQEWSAKWKRVFDQAAQAGDEELHS